MLTLHRSDFFLRDFDLQYRWYLDQAGPRVAERYLEAVLISLRSLSQWPGQGRPRGFKHPDLAGVRSLRVMPPFDRHLIFYRYTATQVSAERIMYGARNLPERLHQPPDTAT